MKVGIVAGESSGDLLGAHLVRALKARRPDLEFVGIAGPRMQAEGVASLFPIERLAVRGYLEVLEHLPDLLRIRARLRDYFLSVRPRLFIGVDAPDFNLGLAGKLKARGIPTMQYVAPAVWAWRFERVRRIGELVTHVLSIFPFEPELFEPAGIPVTYVGHPVAEALPLKPDREPARDQLGVDRSAVAIALLPGSRRSELHYHAPVFIDAARAIMRRLPGVRFMAPFATHATRVQFEVALQRHGAQNLPVTLHDGQAHSVLAAADGAVVASGTASLEAALQKCPMVITYRLSPLSYQIVRRKTRLPYIGLPNVIAGEFIVPEILQSAATGENLAQALVNLIHDEQVRPRILRRFRDIHLALKQNSAALISQAVLPYLEPGVP